MILSIAGNVDPEKIFDQVGKANGCNVSVKRFVRYEVGEGIEKKADNFAEEVMAQAAKQ